MSQAVVVLGPGQGAQKPGMARAWFDASEQARALIATADAVLGDDLGRPLSSIMFDGPREAVDRTDVSQPAIYTASVASWHAMRATDDLEVGEAAGLSLGEYTALHLAGVFDFETGLRLVAARGRLMQEAAETSESAMVALIGADEAQAEQVCETAGGGEILVPANFNAPGQIVISGATEACRRAVEVGQEMGLRTTLLAVAGAFHSPFMQPAADRMAEVLAEADFSRPAVPVWSNVTGERHDPDDLELLRRRLVEQIVSPVRWAQSCASLAAATTMKVHELAPGSVLRGLMRRIDRSVKVLSHDEP